MERPRKNWITDYCLVKDTKLKTEEAGRAPPPSVSITQRHTSLHHSFQSLLFASRDFSPVLLPSSLWGGTRHSASYPHADVVSDLETAQRWWQTWMTFRIWNTGSLPIHRRRKNQSNSAFNLFPPQTHRNAGNARGPSQAKLMRSPCIMLPHVGTEKKLALATMLLFSRGEKKTTTDASLQLVLCSRIQKCKDF